MAGNLVSPGASFTEITAGTGSATPAFVWLSWLATVNLFVLVFNLIPAFPLDGGQIAQALIWWRTGDRNRATRWTGRAGQAFALALGAFGLVVFGKGDSEGLFVLVLAYFLYRAASAAVAQGQFGQRIQGVTVADVMDREPVTIPAALSLLDAQEQFFLRYRWPWFAVVNPARRFLGVVREQRVERGDCGRASGTARDGRVGGGSACTYRRGPAAGVAVAQRGPWAPGGDGRGQRARRAAGRRDGGAGP